jgi:hypothetical protein
VSSPFFKTWIALGVAVALGAWIWFVERERDPDAGEKLYPALAADAVDVVSLAGGDETIRLERDAESWRLVEPVAVAADTATVEDLIGAVERLEIDETLAGTGERAADCGMDPPRRVLRLLDEDGQELARFELGGEVAGGGLVYARAPGRPDVFTVGSGIAGSLEKSAFDFRDRDLLHVERDAVVGLEVSGPEGEYALHKSGDEWRFTRPLETRAGRWSVDGLVGLVAGLRMEEVAAEQAESLAEYGLDPPARRVVVDAGEAGRRILEIGSATEAGRYYARDAASRLVAVIPPALVEDLQKGVDELREKRVADISSFDVQGLSAVVGGQERVWTRSTGKGEDGFDEHTWKRSVPDEAEVERSEIEDALYDLGGLEASAFVDAPGPDSRYGLDAPLAVVKVRRLDKPELVIELGRHEGRSFARRAGDAALLELDSDAVDEIVEALKTL